jgi:hypothetical protein
MMRLASPFLFLVCLILVAATAFADPPLPGSYQSTDLGGTIPVGRYTEGWDTGGGALSAATTQNCGSWDGTTLGAVWRYTCGTQLSDGVLILDTVDANGNGNQTTACTYVGGVFWLSGSGPWANGDADYPGHFDSYVEYETVQYSNFVPISAVTNVQSTAHFDNYPTVCMGFSIANGTRVGTTDLGDVFPPNYPAMLDPNCDPTRTEGAWWDMTSITITLTPDCATPTEASTWGALKAMYH